MKRMRTVNTVIFFISFFFICHSIPALSDDGSFKAPAQNSREIISAAMNNYGEFTTGKPGMKPVFLKTPPKFSYSGINPAVSSGYTSSGSFSREAFFDYRKSIKQSIPHYFHGGKYKSVSFAV